MGITFDHPGYLWLLGLIPLLFWGMRRSLAGLGGFRRLVAVTLRIAVLVCLVLAMAEARFNQPNPAVTVIYVLDQSASVPAESRNAMFRYVAQQVERHRQSARGDKVGVIAFAEKALIEVSPVESNLSWLSRSETISVQHMDGTNLEAALKAAAALFPSECARRIVVISDGNETIGSAEKSAMSIASQGIGIDVVPISFTRRESIVVEKIVVPPESRLSKQIDIRAVIHYQYSGNDDPQPVAGGRLEFIERAFGVSQILSSEEVLLRPGKNVFSIVRNIEHDPGFYSFEARFTAGEGRGQIHVGRASATGFTLVRGPARVLMIVNPESPNDFDGFVAALQKVGMVVDVREASLSFHSIQDLQSYDTVVLADVPRISPKLRDVLFSDQQIEALVRNTEMGCGLVMLGGPNSFAAGSWEGTKLELASPVDFQIKNAKVDLSGALLIVIDRSGSMEGEKLALCKHAASAAVRVLGPNDYVGIIAFDEKPRWVVPIRKVGQDATEIHQRISLISSGGGTVMYPAMELGYHGLSRIGAVLRHMIVLTDGLTEPGAFETLSEEMRQARMTISTVAVGNDADAALLDRIAQIGGGKFYRVLSPRAVPQIFIKEARRVARPVIFEKAEGMVPVTTSTNAITRELGTDLRPITGFVLTTVKDHPLVEVMLRSPQPEDDRNSTLLAGWTYGLGQFVVFTSDVGHRWTGSWATWEPFPRFSEQLIRWAMRPLQADADWVVDTKTEGGETVVSVFVSDPHDESAAISNLHGVVVQPDMELKPLPLNPVGSGRFLGRFASGAPGGYFLTLRSPETGQEFRTGVNVHADSETERNESNWPLLRSLTELAPTRGEAGEWVNNQLADPITDGISEYDPFRNTLAPVRNSTDYWPTLLVMGALVFFFDILNRRVAVSLSALFTAVSPWFRRQTDDSIPEEQLSRLQASKASTRTTTRPPQTSWELPPRSELGSQQVEELGRGGESTAVQKPQTESAKPPHSSEDAIKRLQQAKRAAKTGRKRD